MEKVGRGDKALNPNRKCNGKVTARFGDKVYICWDGDSKSLQYSMKEMTWFEQGKAWVVPFSSSASFNG